MVAVPSDVQKLPILAPKKKCEHLPLQTPALPQHRPEKPGTGKTGKNRESGVSIQFHSRFWIPGFSGLRRGFFHGFSPREKNQGTGNFREKPGNTGKSRHPPVNRKILICKNLISKMICIFCIRPPCGHPDTRISGSGYVRPVRSEIA